MIKIENIVKKFSHKNVINNISLNISKGQIFGLLGPNGAGKTTLIRMLCGILKSDAGKITINHPPLEESKNIFGYLAHDPLVLFLDEPTAGIDPVTRKLLWDDFYALSMEGKTLFVTTHYMEEAQRCNELAFLAQGEIVATGTPTTIKEALGNVTLLSIN